MGVTVGDTVLVLRDAVLHDASVQEIKDGVNTESGDDQERSGSPEFLVHYVDFDGPDEWVSVNQVLQDTPKNRELQLKADAIQREKNTTEGILEKLGASGRLEAIVAWMHTVDEALVRLDKDVAELIHDQASQAAQLVQLERRKAEAEKEKVELEVAVLKDLKRVKVAEETALARKRLQIAGIAQDEIDAILPIMPRTS